MVILKVVLTQMYTKEFEKLEIPLILKKEIETDIIPQVGNYVCHKFIDDSFVFKVTSLTIDYNENKCIATLESYVYDKEERIEEIIEAAKKDGWYK